MTADGFVQVTFSDASATYYQTYNGNWLPSQMIDGAIDTGGNGWAIYKDNGQNDPTLSATALLTLASPVATGPQVWTITIYQNYVGGGGGAHLLGDFSLGYTIDPTPSLSSAFTPFTVTAATTSNGSTLTSLGDGQLLDTGLLPVTDVYTITVTSNSPDPITAIFLNANNDPANSLPTGGPGRFYGNGGGLVGQGNFVVSELTAFVSSAIIDDYAASTATTGVVAIGGSTSGTIETSNDQDWFAVTLTAGVTYQFRSEGASTGQGTLQSPYVELHDNGGGYIIYANGPLGFTYTATSSATYYLAVGSIGGVGDLGTYKVSVSDLGTISDDYAASTATTGVVAIGGSTSGTIETSNDQDWFKVTLTAGQIYRFDLEGSDTGQGTLINPTLYLLDSTGNSIANDFDTGVGNNAQITFAPSVSGTYYLASYGSGLGTYKLSATAAPHSTIVQFGSSYYEYISSPGTSWASAKAAAEAKTYLGAPGYLATVASSAENSFLESLVTTNFSGFSGAWLGGKVFGGVNGTGGSAYWEVGPDAGKLFSVGQSAVAGAYANWGGAEPNDSEVFSAVYMNVGAEGWGVLNGQWADAKIGLANGDGVSTGDNMVGYFVEYTPIISGPGAAPTLALDNAFTTLSEATSTTNRVKVADITITDDGEGTNNLSLSGADAALFEVFDGDLYLKAGTVLDFEGGNTTLDVTVAVDDAGVGGTPDDSESLSISVTNVNETPTGAPTAVLPNGTEDVAYTVAASALLLGFSDPDDDPLSVASLVASSGSVVDNGNGTFTITQATNFNGAVTLTYNVTDGHGGTLTGQTRGYTVTAVNDAPVAVVDVLSGTEDTPLTITKAQLVGNDTDLDNPNGALSIASVTSGAGGIAVLGGVAEVVGIRLA